MTVIFISIHIEKSPVAFPLASAVLKTAVEKFTGLKDCRALLEEFFMPQKASDIADRLIKTGASFFGFSVYTWNASLVIETARVLKERMPDAVIFAGGPQVTAVPGEFRKTGLFSFIVEGEGEGIVPGRLLGSAAHESIEFDFSKSASPYAKVLSEKKYSGVLWEVSRGCPYNCAFCYESRGCASIRTISEQRLIEELKLFRKMEIEKIWVLDPTFNHNKKHAENVLQMILKYNPDAHYTFEIRAELMNETLCRLFSELDASLQIGLQSTDEQVLKSVNRSLDKVKFAQKCKLMSSWGLTYGIDLIYGLPFDSIDKFCESIDFAVSSGPNNIDIFPLAVLPGTELAEKADRYGLNNEGFPSYTITGNAGFPAGDLRKAEAITSACNSLYNKEQAFPWFETILKTLELPASALFERYDADSDYGADIIDFLAREFKKAGKEALFQLFESFILWSRTAEAAFANQGTAFQVSLCRKPEQLDELINTDPETFLARHPNDKMKKYQIIFDGEELYIY
ncbi:MAG: radical SAM protein [Spirochaetales bacterium]|nr:radical SAM protein [Spirochaetales bacterium]